MRHYFGIFLASCFFLAAEASAHSVPESLQSMYPQAKGKARQTASLSRLTIEQQKFLLQDTVIDKAGYLRVSVSPEYLDQMADVQILLELETRRPNNSVAVHGMTLLGLKRENTHRVNYFFGDRSGPVVMITAWRYRDDGAAITVLDDFLNQTVDGKRATLSLATNAESPKCLWKLTASDDEMLYEVIISDLLSKHNSPTMTVAEVLSMTEKLISFTKKDQPMN